MVSPFIGSLSTSIQKINCQDPLSTENEKIKETKTETEKEEKAKKRRELDREWNTRTSMNFRV